MNIIRGVYVSEHKLVLSVDGEILHPKHSQNIINHSPNGFSAGYGGSGVAQSALAVLLHVLGKEKAIKAYQDFKWEFLANPAYLDDHFEIEVDIPQWYENLHGVK